MSSSPVSKHPQHLLSYLHKQATQAEGQDSKTVARVFEQNQKAIQQEQKHLVNVALYLSLTQDALKAVKEKFEPDSQDLDQRIEQTARDQQIYSKNAEKMKQQQNVLQALVGEEPGAFIGEESDVSIEEEPGASN